MVFMKIAVVLFTSLPVNLRRLTGNSFKVLYKMRGVCAMYDV